MAGPLGWTQRPSRTSSRMARDAGLGNWRGKSARGPAAASVARSKVQDEFRELRAHPGPTPWARLRPVSSYTADLGPSECEGMISSESPVLENSTPGLTSGGEETWLRPRLRHRHRAKAAGNSYSLVPTAGRASPRLYKLILLDRPRGLRRGERATGAESVRMGCTTPCQWPESGSRAGVEPGT